MKYLIVFSHDCHWLDFKFAELNALLKLQSIDWTTAYNHADNGINSIFLPIDLPNDDVVNSILLRSITIRAIYEFWSVPGMTFEQVVPHIHSNVDEWISKHCVEKQLSWSLRVESVFASLSPAQKHFFREQFVKSDFDKLGEVNLEYPDLDFWILLDYSCLRENDASKSNADLTTTSIPAYFGRLIGTTGMKDVISRFDLKRRLYLGPTSLNTSLAFILANLAQVQSGDMVLDPFVGTASILVALSHLRCSCFGFDIDARVLRGNMQASKQQLNEDREEQKLAQSQVTSCSSSSGAPQKRDIFANFAAYGLERPELVRLDNHLADRHLTIAKPLAMNGDETSETKIEDYDAHRDNISTLNNNSRNGDFSTSSQVRNFSTEGMYDAIITDPPYGIRAGAKKSGRKGGVSYTIEPERRGDHVPSTQTYPVEEVMLDLLHTAARTLVIGGRLVYLIPTTYDFVPEDLPWHPCLDLVLSCEQSLSSRHGRRAVLMIKNRSYGANEERLYAEYTLGVLSGIRTGFGQLMTKLSRALAADAYYDDAVMKKASNSCIRRKECAAERKRKRQEKLGSPDVSGKQNMGKKQTGEEGNRSLKGNEDSIGGKERVGLSVRSLEQIIHISNPNIVPVQTTIAAFDMRHPAANITSYASTTDSSLVPILSTAAEGYATSFAKPESSLVPATDPNIVLIPITTEGTDTPPTAEPESQVPETDPNQTFILFGTDIINTPSSAAHEPSQVPGTDPNPSTTTIADTPPCATPKPTFVKVTGDPNTNPIEAALVASPPSKSLHNNCKPSSISYIALAVVAGVAAVAIIALRRR